MEKIEYGECKLYIPSVALIESGAVISRVTNKKHIAKDAVGFLKSVSEEILYDYRILDKAIEMGI